MAWEKKMLQTGTLLDGKYRVIREIGRGGMSVVYLAVNERAGKTWALKEVRKKVDGHDAIRAQSIAAEIGMLKKLRHPNLPDIVDVIDYGACYVIVMDYIEGKSLKQILEENGPQESRRVIAWAKQLCHVLHYLHSQDPPIIYRDMKPGNIILRPDGQLSLVDFGTAREYKRENREDTTWLGTRGYAAPEQFGGRRQTDRSTDIYALGATLYHLLTGRSPADTQFVIYPIGRFRPELSGSRLEKIIEKCCQPEPARRFRDCRELLSALEQVDENGAGKWLTKKRKRILLTGILAGLIGVAGAAGLTAYGARSVRNEYLLQISNAESADDFLEAADYYKRAIQLRPEAGMAYEKMLSAMTKDGEISQEEKGLMDEALNAVQQIDGKTVSNLMLFRRNHPKEYAAFVFCLGRDYYIFYPNGQRDANGYLKQITEDAFLPEETRRIAQSLVAITDYYVYAGSFAGDRDWAGANMQTMYSYHSLWTSLMTIISDSETADEQSGGPFFSLAVYREAATQITMNLQSILDAGITKNELEQALASARTYLSEHAGLRQSVSAQKLYEETENAVLNAEQEMKAYFHMN